MKGWWLVSFVWHAEHASGINSNHFRLGFVYTFVKRYLSRFNLFFLTITISIIEDELSLSGCYIQMWKLKHIADRMLKKAKEQNNCTILKTKGAKLERIKKRHMKVILMTTTKQPRANGCVRLAFRICWSYLTNTQRQPLSELPVLVFNMHYV